MKKLITAVLLGLMLVGCGYESQTQATPAKATNKEINKNQPIEFKFASIAAGHLVAENDPSVAKAKILLDKASVKFQTPQTAIADMVVAVKNIADKDGLSFNVYQVLEAMPVMESRNTSSADRFASLISYYMAARSGGQNHTEAVAGVRGLSQIAESFAEEAVKQKN